MSTFKDITVSFSNLLKSRSRNPFYGTLIIVYLFRNYKLIYKLFFLKEKDQLNKISYLDGLFNHEILIEELLISSLYAFTAMASSYVILNLSELLRGVFSNVINIWVKKLINIITNKTNTYSKDEFIKIEQEKNDYERKYINEKTRRLEHEDEIALLEMKIKELSNPINFNEKLLKQIRDRSQIDSFRKIVKVINSEDPITDLENKDKVVFDILIKNRLIKRLKNSGSLYDFTEPKGGDFITHFNNWDDSPSFLRA
jgi:hypothetical protein